jgi:hypothetical protein
LKKDYFSLHKLPKQQSTSLGVKPCSCILNPCNTIVVNLLDLFL